MLKPKSKYLKNPYFHSFLGGVLYALGFPSLIGEPILLLTILGLYLWLNQTLKTESLKKQAQYLLCFSIGFNMTGFYWIARTIEVFGGLSPWISFLMSLLFSLIIVPHLWLFIFLKKFINKKQIFPNPYLPAILALLLTLLEALTPAQFPTQVGQIFITYPSLVTLAHIGGVPIYSYLVYFLVLNFTLRPKKNIASVGLLCLFLLSSWILVPRHGKKIANLKTRIVQANIGNFMKVSSEFGDSASLSEVYQRYYQLSTQEGYQGQDLIIWPETAYPNSLYSEYLKEEQRAPDLIRDIIQQTQVPMLIGGYSRNAGKNAFYESEFNSALFFNKQGALENFYNKMVLIPFGETLPFPSFIKEKLSKVITNVSYFARGESFTQFKLSNGTTFITPICYELLKPGFLRTFLQKQKTPTHFMVNLTNDSWYGMTAEPEQHLFLSKWRAKEFNMPILRSTNTGITTVILPSGETTRRLETGEKKNLDIETPIYQRSPTFYEQFGLLATWLFFFLSIAFIFGETQLLKDRASEQHQ